MASERKQVERVVSRWVIDFYSFLALDSFKEERYSEFNTIHDFLCVLVRAGLSADTVPQTVLVLQFLSSIHEGGQLESISLLDSALTSLEKVCQTSDVSPLDLETIRTSIQKMIIKICIKNMELDRAKEMVHTFFSTNGSDKSHFLSVISSRSTEQGVDGNIDFGEFQCQMLAFCEKMWTFSPPFLYKAATELNQRLGEVRTSTPSTPNYKLGIIPRSRLEKAYNSLSGGANNLNFVQLEEDVEREQCLSLRLLPSEEELGHQWSKPPSQPEDPQTPPHKEPPIDSALKKHRASSCLRMESDNESNSTRLLNMCRFPTSVMDDVGRPMKRLEGKSNGSSKPEVAEQSPSGSPVAQPEKELDGVPQQLDSPEDSFTDSLSNHSYHSTPVRDSAGESGPSTSKWQDLMKNARESKETWPEEESFFGQQHPGSESSSFSSGKGKKMWTSEETAWLVEGVKKFGEGKWSKILSFYGFKDRTNVNLKDRWRTLKKLNLI